MEITLSSSIKKRIMRRVHIIWFTRRVLPLLTLETLAVAFIARQLADSIFFNHVLQNAIVHTFSRSPVMMADFFFRAFLNTDIMIQFLIMGSVLVGILFLRDTVRALRAFIFKSNLSPLSHVI
ncbi:MAG: hypothetical protein A3J54_02595 [Candidatus Ryanbacteria bacterium RIFCSPHIGHO2_02_FULL_45_13b]|uniref:Uncharacterized protein n=1 Tax=Candidatus Ryanbacteria bacterium RIFCSPHIGHO2_02_FULL_45_13b TaxID=1802117 RepID=A0A1G2G8P0_9BACT|nr:MAG: hypothetical protein A3J54_02595 [Candidatus Ryanbacteria bacterium RIFCSPHIGHO2_02_FULL_45_13b]